MRSIRRLMVPMLLVGFGVAAIVEGVWFHPISVLVEKETLATIDIPLMGPSVPSMDEPPSPDGPPGAPPGMAFGAPTSIKKTVTRVDLVAQFITEPELTRDVSVGGVVRLDAGEHFGELQRTYSGKGPALCPS